MRRERVGESGVRAAKREEPCDRGRRKKPKKSGNASKRRGPFTPWNVSTQPGCNPKIGMKKLLMEGPKKKTIVIDT